MVPAFARAFGGPAVPFGIPKCQFRSRPSPMRFECAPMATSVAVVRWRSVTPAGGPEAPADEVPDLNHLL